MIIDWKANEIHVWQVKLDPALYDLPALENFLNTEERRRYGRLLFQNDKDRFLISHAMLQKLLRLYVQEERIFDFSFGEFGKPYLAHPPHFNLSHSGTEAFIAFAADRHVGVDIEKVKIDKDVNLLVERFFQNEEAKRILSLTPPERQNAFYQAWTNREALGKAEGVGFLKTIDINSSDYFTQDLTAPPGYKAALAACGSQQNIRIRRYHAEGVS